ETRDASSIVIAPRRFTASARRLGRRAAPSSDLGRQEKWLDPIEWTDSLTPEFGVRTQAGIVYTTRTWSSVAGSLSGRACARRPAEADPGPESMFVVRSYASTLADARPCASSRDEH